MKKYLFLLIFVILLTGCNKRYSMVCSGDINLDNDKYKLNVTIHYNIQDKVESLDYEMIYEDADMFNKACEESKDKNPTCGNLTIKYSENDEITTSFDKDEVKNMLYVIGATECK